MDHHQALGLVASVGGTVLDSSDLTHFRPVHRHGLFESHYPTNNGSMDSPASKPWVCSTSTTTLLAALTEHPKRPHERLPSRLPETNVSAAFVVGSGKGYEAVV
jgi:hypothetical protein